MTVVFSIFQVCFLFYSFSISQPKMLKMAKIQVLIFMTYKICKRQINCNIRKAGQKCLLQFKWPHLILQVILKCKTDDRLGFGDYISHAALRLDCATQHKHSSLDEVAAGMSTRHGDLMEAATCNSSVYVHYEVHNVLIQGGGGGRGLSPLEGCS